MNKITIKINGHLYEAWAEDICDIAENFVKNINHFCEIELLNEKLSIRWRDLDRYTIMQMPRKRTLVKVKEKVNLKKLRR